MSKPIMTVDDSASVRQMVAFTLKQAGYDIIEAEDGRDALNKSDGANLNMVITDLNMPNMDGIDLVKALRQKPQYRFMPIIMFTTESQLGKNRKVRPLEQPDGSQIIKPEQLLAVIKKGSSPN